MGLWKRFVTWWRGPESEPEVITGRQRLRRATQDEAATQLAGASVDRKTRRAASKDLSKRIRRRQGKEDA